MEFKSQAFTIADLYNWWQKKELTLQPRFQRRKVWRDIARSYLIDTVVRGLPMPKIYYRMQVDPVQVKSVREVVDGQQRLDAIFSYIENKFAVSKSHDSVACGKTYKELPESIKSAILSYDISADLLIGADDGQVLQIFARINSYSVTLNAQEKRNAKFFGQLKDLVYSLGTTHLAFWTGNKILTDQHVARMQEAELTSELVVAMLDGLQDKKTSLDRYYKLYETSMPGRKELSAKFEKVLTWVDANASEFIKSTAFKRRPLFYSLFLAVADALFGIKNGEGPISNFPVRGLSESQRSRLGDELRTLTSALRAKVPPPSLADFAHASSRQTDNLRPRQARHRRLIKVLRAL